MEKKTIRAIELVNFIICFFIAVIIAFLIRYFIGEIIEVQHVSMMPTLSSGDRAWISKIGKTFNKIPKRGDIITFEAPTIKEKKTVEKTSDIAKYEEKNLNIFQKFKYYALEIGKTSYIKRVIGLPGEKIKINNGNIYINGKKLDESSYLNSNVKTDTKIFELSEVQIPDDCIFVLGDNREESADSRYFGCIPINKIEGKVIIRIWPFSKFGKI